MSAREEDNPYRSPAYVADKHFADEDVAEQAAPESPATDDGERDELQRLKEMERDCRHLALMTAVFLASIATGIALVDLRLGPPGSFGGAYRGQLAIAAWIGYWTSMFAMLFVGAKLLRTTTGGSIYLLSIGLLVPLLNVFVAYVLFLRAAEFLASRGVRLRWRGSDYSRADLRPASLQTDRR